MQNLPQTAYKIPVYLTQERRCFYANIKVKLPFTCDESLFEEIYGVMDVVDRYYNSYTSGSYIDQINKNAGNWVDVDDTCVWLIQQLKNFAELFDGIYDITSMPLLKLWGFYDQKQNEIPTSAAIDTVLKKVDFRQIEIDGERVRIAKGQEIITGSFLKSFAVDLAMDYIRDIGIKDALINAGGSSMRVLNNYEHPHWKIKIPFLKRDDKEQLIRLSNKAFSYSGMGNNFKQIDGQKYSHILNAKTGYPSAIRQVVIISNSSFEGDVLATALYATGDDYEKYIPSIEAMGVSGFVVDSRGRKVNFGIPLEEEVLCS